jgi:hypothetical protein
MCIFHIPLHDCGDLSPNDETRSDRCEYYKIYLDILPREDIPNKEAIMASLLAECKDAREEWLVLTDGLCQECARDAEKDAEMLLARMGLE